MNPVSPGTVASFSDFDADLACLMRSRDLETRFYPRSRSLSSDATHRSRAHVAAFARISTCSPGGNGAKRPGASSTQPTIRAASVAHTARSMCSARWTAALPGCGAQKAVMASVASSVSTSGPYQNSRLCAKVACRLPPWSHLHACPRLSPERTAQETAHS